MKEISGGVTAALGFKAAGIHCGLRKNKDRRDLALVFSETDCAAAAVYTTNKVKAAPIYVTMEHLESGSARAIVCCSGNANACAPDGQENAERMCSCVAKELGIKPSEVIVASTGVIGQRLNIDVIETAAPALAKALSERGSDDAASAIMTTDLRKKEVAVELEIGGKTVKIGGIAKGSGMIMPNMGTMLAFITTDAAITSEMLHAALYESTQKTYNRVCVDGDTSTNDMAAILASGLAGNAQIEWKSEDYYKFYEALSYVNSCLARLMARDGEGASRLVTCRVYGSRGEDAAERLAMSVISSSLVKAAMFGADANWGRVLCAMGYSKAPFRPEYVDIEFCSKEGSILVCEKGAGLSFDEEKAKRILSQEEVSIEVNLNEGACEATCWGCDLTYDYVKINGDYRT